MPGIVSRARSNAVENANIQDSPPDDFSEETFHKYLLRFIVADDQVPIFTHRSLKFAHWHISHDLFRPLYLVSQCHRMQGISAPLTAT